MGTSKCSEEKLEQLPDDKRKEWNEIILNAQKQFDMMEQMIKEQIQVKDGLIDKLHKELEYYKKESAERFVDQIMKALIKVRKDMKKQINSEKWEEFSVDDMRREYVYVFEDLSDLLEQQNIDPYESSEGDTFDAAKQQAFKVERTEEPSLDKKIKKSVSEGYTKGKKVLIAERVIVYQYQREKGE